MECGEAPGELSQAPAPLGISVGCVDIYGLISDQTSGAVWSLLPVTIPARNKSKPSE